MKTVKLTQLCAIKGGIPAPKKTTSMGNVPFVRMRELGDAHLSSVFLPGQEFLTDVDEKAFVGKLIEPGAVLFPRSGSVHLNHRAHLESKAAIVSHIGALIPKKGTDSLFLYHLLTDYDMTEIMTQTTGLNMIRFSQLADIEFQIPDTLPEQTKIAEILSTVDLAIEQTEALIAKQQRIKTGLMQDLLTRGIDEHGNLRSEQTHEFKDSPLGRIPVEWKIGGFENYVISEAGIKPGPFGSSLTKDMYVEAGYRVYGQEQVIGGTLNIGDYFITGCKYSEMCGFAVEEGDVLISLVGTIGHVLIVPHRYHPGVINPRLLRFRPDPRHCVPQFLKALLLSQPVRLQLDTFATGGTMPVLSGGILRKLRVVIFDLNEQKRIIQIIEGSEAALLSSSTHLAKLRSLKIALMQDLLTGKKRVTALLNETEKITS